MNATDGITYLAGISKDKTNISIILSNYEGLDQDYSISMNNVPWDSSYRLIHYLIDEDNHLEIIKELDQDSSTFQYTNILEKSSIHVIRLTNSSTIPDEGPIVLEIPFFLRLKILDPLRSLIGLVILILFFS